MKQRRSRLGHYLGYYLGHHLSHHLRQHVGRLPGLGRLTALALMTIGAAACQAPMRAGSECTVEPGTLASEATFVWRSEPATDVDDGTGYVSPLAVKALEAAAIETLEAKGFTHLQRNPQDTDDQPSDLEVALTLRTRRELVSLHIDNTICNDVDCWERIDPGAATRMDVRTIGFLAADVYFLNEPIWRGWVETTLYPKDRNAAEAVIARAIPKLFESFPP